MIVDVKMPKLGESIMEGTIIKWAKKVGDWIKKDETLLEISTDKVDSEIPSPFEGKIVEILYHENDTVPVGTVIARIEVESAEGLESGKPSSEKAEEEPRKEASTRSSTSFIEKQPTRTQRKRVPSEKGDKSSFFSPLVLNIAQREGISMDELSSIPGSGRGGRVTKRDILQYVEEKRSGRKKAHAAASPSPAPSQAAPMSRPTISGGEDVEIIPMDPVRKKIAFHMRQSLDTSAHVYSVAECDMTHVRQILERKKESFLKEEGFKLTYNPFILWAVTRALKDYPLLNSSIEGENIIRKKYIHLGMAVATDRGLLVPVIKNADERSFRGIARQAYDLAIRTRDRKLKVEDVEGATFSVTNPGVFGNIFGLPIINQPNVAILGVGAIKKRPVVIESEWGDTIAIRSMVYLSLSFDHRLIDGDIGGKFLQRVVSLLEEFPEEEV